MNFGTLLIRVPKFIYCYISSVFYHPFIISHTDTVARNDPLLQIIVFQSVLRKIQNLCINQLRKKKKISVQIFAMYRLMPKTVTSRFNSKVFPAKTATASTKYCRADFTALFLLLNTKFRLIK